jgi:hypothetical protein
MRRGAEAALLLEVVHLHHHTVGLVVELVAARLELGAVGDHRLEIGAPPRLGVHREAARAEGLQRLPVRARPRVRGLAHVIEEDGQRPRRGDRGIFLAHRARGGVARIGEGLLARLHERGIVLAEGGERHVDLAPDLQRGDAGERAVQPLGDLRERGEGVGDVLADAAVAPGGAPHEAAALVE